ncbi:MAG TPA: FecR domain-containing protein [Prolixibacteraceae bacterium]|nr:FecR domain-containing protein [Prolixibacteraceae bacterium]
MGNNHKTNIKLLLNQLSSGSLTIPEKEKLKEYIESSFMDEDLDALMREHWTGLGNQDLVGDEIQLLNLKKKILSRITPAQPIAKKEFRLFPPDWKNKLMRVAAILFIPLLLGSVAVFYTLEKQINQQTSSSMQQVMASPGSRVHFTLPDKTEVWLNSESVLEFPLNLDHLDQRRVKLTGQGYFKVAHDKLHPFFVEVNKMSIKALGTSFDVSGYENDNFISSTLEEGSIALLSLKGKEFARLVPGQQAVWNKSTNELEINDIETIQATSWKDGKLIFRNASLNDVTRQLERWFNCVIQLDPKLNESDLKYTATIQDETLGEVLKMIEISTSVKTKIVKREVYIGRTK